MLRRLRAIVSLCNLHRHPFSFLSLSRIRSPRSAGQIATILLLLIVAAIILVLVTVNIGNVSVTTMTVVTGTDTAGLFLGSQLASRAHSIYHQLGDERKACVKGGLLGVILAVVAAVVVTVATYGYGAYVAIPLAAAAGAIGGAIGQYAIHGTASAAVQGAALGAVIGASMAAGAVAFAPAAGGVAATDAAITSGVGAGMTVSEATEAAILAGAGTVLQGGSATFAVGFSAAAGASAAYNSALVLDMDTGLISDLVKAMNGLPEYEMVRENVFLQALQKVVDDPNKIPDSDDIDGDENTAELVPQFAYWWRDHIATLQAALDVKGPIIDEFLQDVFIPYFEQIRLDMLPTLDRKEVECTCSPAESRGIGLMRVLYECGYPISWEPGPGRDELIAWYCDPEDTPPPAGFDYVDGLRYILEEFVNYGRGVLQEREDECGIYYEYDIDALDKGLKFNDCLTGEQDWFDMLYCPGDDGDMLSAVEESIEILETGLAEIMTIRDGLPGCQLKYGIYEERWVTSGMPIGAGNYTGGHACQCPIPANEIDLAATIDPAALDEVTGEETTALCEEVYPCYWVNQSSDWVGEPYDTCRRQDVGMLPPADCLEDIHFPNPVCKVYPEDREQLLAEINDLRELVANLEDHIIEKYFAEGNPCPTPPGEEQLDPDTLPEYDPDIDLTVPPVGCDPGFNMSHICPPTTDAGNFSNLTNGTTTNTTGNETNVTNGTVVAVPECESETLAIEINVSRVCLYANVHDACSATPLGSGDGILRYEFSYNVTCSCCDYDIESNSSTTNTSINITTNTTVTNTTTNTTENTTINTTINGTITTNTTDITAEYTPASLSGQAWGWSCVAPDIDLNVVGLCDGPGDCLMRDDFLVQLDRFEEYLLSLNEETNRPTSECDPDGALFATIDQDAYDEFAPVTATLCNTLLATQLFVEEVPNWEPRLQQDNGSIPRATDGGGTLTPPYEWDDNRGHHSVSVTTGPFHFAWVKKEKSGNFAINKTCMVLKDYCDNIDGCHERERIVPGSTFVEVIRQDDPDTRDLPAAGKVNLGLKWNPFYTGRVRRKARVAYRYNFVGIGGID